MLWVYVIVFVSVANSQQQKSDVFYFSWQTARKPAISDQFINFQATKRRKVRPSQITIMFFFVFFSGSVWKKHILRSSQNKTPRKMRGIVVPLSCALRIIDSENWWGLEIHKKPTQKTESFTPVQSLNSSGETVFFSFTYRIHAIMSYLPIHECLIFMVSLDLIYYIGIYIYMYICIYIYIYMYVWHLFIYIYIYQSHLTVRFLLRSPTTLMPCQCPTRSGNGPSLPWPDCSV